MGSEEVLELLWSLHYPKQAEIMETQVAAPVARMVQIQGQAVMQLMMGWPAQV
jgi:hypothetical protein